MLSYRATPDAAPVAIPAAIEALGGEAVERYAAASPSERVRQLEDATVPDDAGPEIPAPPSPTPSTSRARARSATTAE